MGKKLINDISLGQYFHCSPKPKLEYDYPYGQMILDAFGPNFLKTSSCQSFYNIEPYSSHPCEP